MVVTFCISVLIEDTVTNGGMRSCASCPTGTKPDESGFDCVGETSTFNMVGEHFFGIVLSP